MDLDYLTGLNCAQRAKLHLACTQILPGLAKPGGRPPVLGLFDSIMMVVMLMRRNVTQEFAGAIFGCSQATVSRRWDLLRPVIQMAVAVFIPDPREIIGTGTALVDGTIYPTWDWAKMPELFSAKEDMAGVNVQIAGSIDGRLAAVGTQLVPGSRHDAYAFAASGLKTALSGIHTAADRVLLSCSD